MSLKIVPKKAPTLALVATGQAISSHSTKPAPVKLAPPPAPKPKAADKEAFTWPSQLAICRNLAGGDLAAGVLLYRIVGLWQFRKKRLERFDREWLAMSRDDWARSAGLSLSELKNRALPLIKKHCGDFVAIRPMRLTPNGVNLVWISLNPDNMPANITPWDMHEAELNGHGIFPKAKPYPYKSGESLD